MIKARRFVIATGSRPFVPPIPGLEDVPYYTNETIFDLRERPEHLIDHRRWPDRHGNGAGASAAGLQGHRDRGRKAMGKDDPEMAAIVLERCAPKAIEIDEGRKPPRSAARRDDHGRHRRRRSSTARIC